MSSWDISELNGQFIYKYMCIYICIYIYTIYIYTYIYTYIYIHNIYNSQGIMVIGAPYPNPQGEKSHFQHSSAFQLPEWVHRMVFTAFQRILFAVIVMAVLSVKTCHWFLPPKKILGMATISPINMVMDWGMIYDCFNHITIFYFMTTQSRKILSSFHAYWGCFSDVFRSRCSRPSEVCCFQQPQPTSSFSKCSLMRMSRKIIPRWEICEPSPWENHGDIMKETPLWLHNM